MDGIIGTLDMSLSKLRETVKDREACPAADPGVKESDTTERLNDNKGLGQRCDYEGAAGGNLGVCSSVS